MQEHTCYCRPCRRKKDTEYHEYGLLGATAFIIVMAVVPAVVVIGSLSLCLYLFQRHSRNKQLLPSMLPYSELTLNAESEVLSQGTYGYASIAMILQPSVMCLLRPASPCFHALMQRSERSAVLGN